jgi:hypothetical protein
MEPGRPKLWADRADAGGLNQWDQAQLEDDEKTRRFQRLMGARTASNQGAASPASGRFAVQPGEPSCTIMIALSAGQLLW